MNIAEYEALRKGAGVIAWDAWGVVEVAGADRAAFLHNLLSNDIKALTAGRACRSALLTPNGKMIAELVVLAAVDRHWLLTPRACLASLLSTLDRYLITEDVMLADRTEAWMLLALQGPKTPEIMRALSGIRAADYSITDGPGVVLMSAANDAPALQAKLASLGAAAASWEAANVCRVEAGVPWWGADMDETTLLPETGLERRLASFTKGCYVGQEIVARMDTYGSASRKLMRLTCEGTDVPTAGDQIVKDGEPVGAITSAVFSPSLHHPIALGYIKRPHYATHTPVTILCHGRAVSAAVEPRKS